MIGRCDEAKRFPQLRRSLRPESRFERMPRLSKRQGLRELSAPGLGQDRKAPALVVSIGGYISCYSEGDGGAGHA
jgi:hypothetical protein